MSATLKSLETLKSKMNNQQQEFQEIIKEFELQKQKFEEEKQQVDQYLAQNDILYLNVGGVHFCTLRSTLTFIKNTIFDNLFDTDKKLLVDRDNRIFLDYDPELFKLMLNQLRQWIEVNDSDQLFELPKTSFNDRQRFRNFLRHLKFDEKHFDLQFYDSSNELVGRIVQASSRSDDNQNNSYTSFYGSQMYSTGCHRVQIKFLNSCYYNVSRASYFQVGIANFEQNKKNPQSSVITWPCHTVLPSPQGVCNEIEDGDIFEIEIDCNDKLVTVTNQRTMKGRHQIVHDSVPLPWRLYVQLPNDQSTPIRII
ncbi:unnamed protein product [Rotaria sp. Silwood2]|nr:unnamed protein product [Rotaria sp. Silwood2]CAF4193026.1 unnamed protein product [Rotaria sp. Silwood2]